MLTSGSHYPLMTMRLNGSVAILVALLVNKFVRHFSFGTFLLLKCDWSSGHRTSPYPVYQM